MSKLAPETVTTTPNQDIYINFNFAADMGTADAAGTPTFSSSPALVFTQITVTGKKAQAHIDFGGKAEGTYLVDCLCDDNSSPTIQKFEGRGTIVVQNVG